MTRVRFASSILVVSSALAIVSACDTGEHSGGVSGPAPEDSRAPATPTNLRAAPARSGEIELAWTDASVNEDRFELQFRRSDETGWTNLATVPQNTTRFVHTGVVAGRTYTYRLEACNQTGCSSYSTEASATGTSPAAPTDITATANGSGRVDLAWKDNSGDETRFDLQYRDALNTSWYSFGSLPANTTSYAHTGLTAGTTYAYRVSACSEAGCSAFTADALVTVLGPVAPTGIMAQAVGSGRIDVTWKDNSADEAYFAIEYRRAPDAGWYSLASVPANGTGYSHMGLSAGDTYTYRVRSCNQSGCSDTREEAQAKVGGPAAPSAIKAVPVGSGRLDLSWADNSADEANFTLEYRLAPGSSWYVLDHTSPNATSYAHTGLSAGDVYTYRVSACNQSGCSAPSAEAQATVQGPAAPSGLAAAPVGSGRIDLAWQDNSADESRFEVQSRKGGTSSWYVLESVPANSRNYSDLNLTAGDSWSYRIRACNASGCSTFSNEASATVAGPAAPSGLTATAGASQITIAWRDNSNDEDVFEIQERATSSMYWDVLNHVSAGVTTYTHGGLATGSSYAYRVRACNRSGCSTFSAEASATVGSVTPPPPPPPGTLPSTPALLSPANGAHSVSRRPALSWSGSGATSYRLMVATSASALPTASSDDACSACVINQEVSASSFNITTTLAQSTTYYWQVKGRNASGTSAWSSRSSFTTIPPPGPLACGSGFSPDWRITGALLCARGTGSSTEYVVIADLSQGARVMNGYVLKSGQNQASSPIFNELIVQEWWDILQPKATLLCVFNGAFFTPNYELSFPMRDGGQLITIGGDSDPGKSKAVLLVYPDSVAIRSYPSAYTASRTTVDSRMTGTSSAIVGFAAGYGKTDSEGQTFAAVLDRTDDGFKETALFFIAADATPSEAQNVLQSFGVTGYSDNAIRFDGGGSTQIHCANGAKFANRDNPLLPGARAVPHVFMIGR